LAPKDNKINTNNLIKSHVAYQSIIELRDEDFGLLQLKNDLIYERIPKEIIHDIISCTLKIGEYAAKFFLNKYSPDPEKLAEALNIKILKNDTSENKIGPIYIFSEYRSSPPTIIIYSKAMQELKSIINKHNLNTYLKVDDPTPIFIAHEIFHHLEETMIGNVGQVFKIKIFSIGPFRKTLGINVLSDITAYHFAKKLLNLQFPPALLPYLILIERQGRV